MVSPSGLILRFAWTGAILTLFAALGLILFALLRHASRRSRLRRFQKLGRDLEPLLRDLYEGVVGYDHALKRLRALSADFKQRSIQELLMGDRNPPGDRVRVLRRLCNDLGWVTAWQQQLIPEDPAGNENGRGHPTRRDKTRYPLSFVGRAEAAENLGTIRHHPSWRVLVQALSDSHVTVRSVAARALGAIGEPESFGRLADLLRSAALDFVPEISTGALKMALAGFPLSAALDLREFLEDPSPAVRSLAAGVVAAMVQHEAAPGVPQNGRALLLHPQLAELLFDRLGSDENAEVRARVGEIAGYVEDVRSLPLLRILANDPEWFVRLHAVRALAHHPGAPVSDLSGHLTDRHWRVREAAAQALSAEGDRGVGGLLDHFSNTQDRYSQEQIAEQIGKSGLLPSILESFGIPGRDSETRFVEGMVRIGQGEALLAALENGTAKRCLDILKRAFASNADIAIRCFAERLAGREVSRLPTMAPTADRPAQAGLSGECSANLVLQRG
jgi:HEAT repeat protein